MQVEQWVFWSALAIAYTVASYRVWNSTFANALQERAKTEDAALQIEDPRLKMWFRWPEPTGLGKPIELQVRNLGKRPISQFTLRPLQIGPYVVEFQSVANLGGDIDRVIPYVIRGPSVTPGEDLLDILTIYKVSQIAPIEYSLRADTMKQNGQMRTISFALSYAPMHNIRRMPDATEPDRCLTIADA